MTDVTILHNTACSTSRHALDEAFERGVAPGVVQYLKKPLTRDELLGTSPSIRALRVDCTSCKTRHRLDKLEDPAAELVRKDGFFKDLGLSADDYTTPEAVADLLVEHPRLMQRPVLVRGDRAIIGRPRDRVAKFLT